MKKSTRAAAGVIGVVSGLSRLLGGSAEEEHRWPWEAYASHLRRAVAAVSFYSAVGGTSGLRGVGGFAEGMAHSRGTGATAVIWATVRRAHPWTGRPLRLWLPSGQSQGTRRHLL